MLVLVDETAEEGAGVTRTPPVGHLARVQPLSSKERPLVAVAGAGIVPTKNGNLVGSGELAPLGFCGKRWLASMSSSWARFIVEVDKVMDVT